MPLPTGRDYCLQYPAHILRTYGAGVFLAALLKRKSSLLQIAAEHLQAHGYPMPGELGRAYRLAALLEFRMAQFYAALAERFADQPLAAALFEELRDEEEEHGRLMQLCRYTVMLSPAIRFVPHLGDPEVRALRQRLRQLRNELPTLTLERALELVEELEQSEINTIFDKLLRQATDLAIEPFAEAVQRAGEHATSVPQRIARLSEQLVT